MMREGRDRNRLALFIYQLFSVYGCNIRLISNDIAYAIGKPVFIIGKNGISGSRGQPGFVRSCVWYQFCRNFCMKNSSATKDHTSFAIKELEEVIRKGNAHASFD